MSCWTVLRISPTKNTNNIKEAYNKLSCSLSKDLKSFEELTLAYKKAISLATASLEDLHINTLNSANFDTLSSLINSSADDNTIDSIDKFINKVNDIYTNPKLRFSKNSWISLLRLPILNNSSINKELEINLINYIYTHKYLPSSIYKLLDSKFNWTNNIENLKNVIDNIIIDSVINEINNPLPLSYNYLSDINENQLDKYLSLREKAYSSIIYNNTDIAKNYLFDAYSIYTKDLDLLKLLGTYYLKRNDNLMALNYFREAISINNNDMYCLSKFGHLLSKNNQYSNAIYYLEKYLKKLKNKLDIDCIIDLAHCYNCSYDLQKSKDLYTLLVKLRPWDSSLKIELETINNKLSKDSISLPLTIPIYKKYLNPYTKPLINKLSEIYKDFSLRINEKSWEDLFLLPIASNEILFYLLEQIIIEFITTNKNIPKNIFTFLSNKFDWLSRHDELIVIYPNLKIDYLFNRLYINDSLSYDYLTDINPNILEEYIELRSIAYDLINNGSPKAEKYLNKALNLYDKDFEIYKLLGQYYSNNNNYYNAIKNFKIVLSIKPDDYYSICSLALLLTKTENYKDALYYLNKSVNTPAGKMLLDNEDFLCKYAVSFYYTNDLINAKKYFKMLYKLNPNIKFTNLYLKNINARLCGKKREIVSSTVLLNAKSTNSRFKNEVIYKLSNIIKNLKDIVVTN